MYIPGKVNVSYLFSYLEHFSYKLSFLGDNWGNNQRLESEAVWRGNDLDDRRDYFINDLKNIIFPNINVAN